LDFRLVTGLFSLDSHYFSTSGKGKWLSMNTVGKKLPDFIQNHEKVGLAIPWAKYILENQVLREHLENMHHSPLFKLGWLNYLDIKQAVEEFKSNPVSNFPLMRSLFFNSYWYKIQFDS
jgi:asparagine synthase (glutamine-hydrolysing)